MTTTPQNQPTINQKTLEDLLKLIEQANKPGYRTTEFYTTAFATITSLVTGIAGYSKTASGPTEFIPLGIMLLIIFLAIRQYVIARTEIKQAPLATAGIQATVATSASEQTGVGGASGECKTVDGKTITIKDGKVIKIS